MNADQRLIDRCVDGFRRHHKRQPERVAFAPGRVNLIGEHTDYNEGFVLPCALPIGSAVAVAHRDDASIRAIALDLDREDAFACDHIVALPEGHWANHVRGVAAGLPRFGFDVAGADIAIAGNVPRGSGLSSSASLGVALGMAFSPTADRVSLAKVAQWSEHRFVGSACGIMDQLASACGVEGNALLIDCRSLEAKAVPLPPGAEMITVHSGVTRELAQSAYNKRREQCETAARHFGVRFLRDLDAVTLERDRAGLDETIYRRARHVVTENARTLAARDAMIDGDIQLLGELIRQSHVSLRDDFEVTVPAVDALFEAMNAVIGTAGGARMTGGGFGGCMVAVVARERAPALDAALERHFRPPNISSPFRIHTRPAAGAFCIELNSVTTVED